MNWLIIAIIAEIILGTAVVFDKRLLSHRVPDPVVYTFGIGMLGIFSSLLLPFGFSHLSVAFIFLALVSGIIFLSSLLVVYIVLVKTDVSSTLPLAAAFVPLWALPLSAVLIGIQVSAMDVIGMLFLILGAFVFFCAERKHVRTHLLLLVAGSAFLYGLSSVLQKIVFQHSNFVTGFFWTKMGEVLCALILLIVPRARKRILDARVEMRGLNSIWYFTNRAWASLGSVLLGVAVFLSHPALVQSIQSLRFAIIFVASWFILRERSYGKIFWLKICATLFIALGIMWISITNYARNIPYDPNRAITWGVSFSEKYSRELGLDPRETLNAMLSDLHPQAIRLIAYWDEIEPSPGVFDFSSLDWQIEEAGNAQARVILSIGMRVPRWPECFMPSWASGLTQQDREQAVHQYITALINHYRSHGEIMIWQLENEPFLTFGKCPARDVDFIEQELAIMRSLDSRPILLSDSGELGRWYKAAKLGDMFEIGRASCRERV